MASPRSKRLLKTLAKLSVAAVILYLMFRWFEHSQVYRPYSRMDAEASALGRPSEEVWFNASDGVELNGWFFSADLSSTNSDKAVLICHGNAGNISHRLSLYELWLQAGFNVFAFDYRGYGRSKGRPSEEGTYQDAQAAYAWLTNKGFEPTNVIVHGESLGGGVASELAIRERIGGLVLHSTFTSIPDLGSDIFPWLPVRWLSSIKYDTRKKLPRIHVPVLILHSRTDSIIGFQHGQRLFEVAPEHKLFREVAGDHNDQPGSDPEGFSKSFQEFLDLIDQTCTQKVSTPKMQ